MKSFLTKISIFTIFLFVIIFTLSTISIMAIKGASLEIPVSKHILVLGHSHAECAINDTILGTYFNYANSNELEKMQYHKLVEFHKSNPHIDTIIVPLFSETCVVNPLSHELNNIITDLYIEKAIRFSDAEDWKYLLSQPRVYSQLAQLPYKNINITVRYLLGNKPTYNQINSGGYLYLQRDKLQTDIQRRKGGNTEPILTSFAIPKYLKTMIEYCHTKGLVIILMEYPIYHQKEFFNTDKFNEFKKVAFKGIPIAEYGDYILPEEAYGDIRHINHLGATMLSNDIEQNGLRTVIY